MRLEKQLHGDLERVAAEVARWPEWKRSLQPCPCLREGILDDGKHPVKDCPRCGGSGLYLPQN
jgi:hypothetical protein